MCVAAAGSQVVGQRLSAGVQGQVRQGRARTGARPAFTPTGSGQAGAAVHTILARSTASSTVHARAVVCGDSSPYATTIAFPPPSRSRAHSPLAYDGRSVGRAHPSAGS